MAPKWHELFGKKTPQGRDAVLEKELPARPFHLDQRNVFVHIAYGPYVYFAIAATLLWLANLLTMIGLWAHDGKPRYRSDEGSVVVFISDVAAAHKTVFLVLNCALVFCYIASMLCERWLRHVDRIPTDVRKREWLYDWLAIIFAIIGCAGLLLLSIQDAFNHSTGHWIGTLIFVLGIAISAIFQSMEVWSIHKSHPDRKHLLRCSIYKLVVVTITVLSAIGFGVSYALSNRTSKGCDVVPLNSYCNRTANVAAGFEWTTAFLLVFYFFTLVADLWPAGKSSPRYMRRLARWQEKHAPPHAEHDFTGRRVFNMEGSEQIWRGPDGHALDPNAPVPNDPVVYGRGGHSIIGTESGRPSIAQNSETGLMRQV